MADGEVKIHVGFEADTKGADEAQRKLDEINRKAEPSAKPAPAPQPTARPQQNAGGLPNSAKDLSGAFGNMGSGIAENLYKTLFEKLKNGDLTEAGMPSRILQKIKPLYDAGKINSPADFRDWVQNGEKSLVSTGQSPPPPASRSQQGRSQTASEANPKAPDEAERTAAKAARERAGEARKVSAESREQLTLEEKKKRIAALHKAADAYDARGDMDVAARSARADARVLEREVAKETKSRATEEQRITKEAKEQEALRKAGIGVGGRRIAAGAAAFGQDILSGGATPGSASSAMLGAGMRTGNPVVMVTAVAAALATGLAGLLAKEQDKDTSQRLKFDENRANDRFRSQRAWGVFGGSAALMSSSLAAEEEVAKRKAAEPGLKEKARAKWYDPSTWEWGGLRKNAGHREEEENENERIAAGVRAASEKKRASARYEQTDGKLELDALRGRSKRSLSGQREAFVAEESAKALAKYTEAKRQGASEDMAKEMATLTYQNDLRDRQAQAGAGLVSAKSGGAEIAAAARWGMSGTPQESEIKSEFGRLIGVIQGENQESRLEKLHK